MAVSCSAAECDAFMSRPVSTANPQRLPAVLGRGVGVGSAFLKKLWRLVSRPCPSPAPHHALCLGQAGFFHSQTDLALLPQGVWPCQSPPNLVCSYCAFLSSGFARSVGVVRAIAARPITCPCWQCSQQCSVDDGPASKARLLGFRSQRGHFVAV